ncbi:hypothetical protein pb186bvf_019358 [Paramecium bursaria]
MNQFLEFRNRLYQEHIEQRPKKDYDRHTQRQHVRCYKFSNQRRFYGAPKITNLQLWSSL